MQEALKVYQPSLVREPRWGDDFFGIEPFYVVASELIQRRRMLTWTISAVMRSLIRNILLLRSRKRKPRTVGLRPGRRHDCRKHHEDLTGAEAPETHPAGGITRSGQDESSGCAGEGFWKPARQNKPL